MLSVIILSVIMLSVIMLSIIMMNVMYLYIDIRKNSIFLAHMKCTSLFHAWEFQLIAQSLMKRISHNDTLLNVILIVVMLNVIVPNVMAPNWPELRIAKLPPPLSDPRFLHVLSGHRIVVILPTDPCSDLVRSGSVADLIKLFGPEFTSGGQGPVP